MNKFVEIFLAPAIRHVMTAVAGALVAKGIIEPSAADSTAVVLAGIATGSVGFALSMIKNARHAATVPPHDRR